jgi:hypothetical protein
MVFPLLGAGKGLAELDFWVNWWPVLAGVGAWLGLVVILLFLLSRIDYRIGPKHLKVTLLGIPIRRLRLDNIRNIHTRRVRVAEKWHNQLFAKPDRILVIEKRRGLFKSFVITPEQRFVFKMELDRAIRTFMGLPPGPTAADVRVLGDVPPPATGVHGNKPRSGSVENRVKEDAPPQSPGSSSPRAPTSGQVAPS